MELRNFATCMAILDGLENLIIKQLPAWKHLPSKCINIREALESARVSRIALYPRHLELHNNLFITQFVITRFWLQHGSKMDPKNV